MKLEPAIRSVLAILTCALGLGAGAPAASAATRWSVGSSQASSQPVAYWFANANFQVSESVGEYPLTIERSDDSQSGVICWGVTTKTSEAGTNFREEANQQVSFQPGQSQATAYVRIFDQGINGPARLARAYMYRCGGDTEVRTPNVTLTLLQDDPLQVRDDSNVLGYAQPTDGDQLQNIDWYVFSGAMSGPGKAAMAFASRDPGWSRALHVLADTPGSESYRFFMWNQPTSRLAATVERYLADAEQAQPGTTVALSTYSLVHGYCIDPNVIRTRYQRWIQQLADGIGNFRVVLYLEEDSLITTHCLTHQQLMVRLHDELAYAVKALARDPHALVYLDAGASDALVTPARDAWMLRQADVAQAAGFYVNSTHFQWTTTEVHYGQQIAELLGGTHFIVQTGDNGRGPLLNPHPGTQGIENLCNPPGRGLGVLSWKTGYKYVDGFLWFNNPGGSGGSCGGGPPTGDFWPAYAVGLVQRRVNHITGPRYDLIRSQTDM